MTEFLVATNPSHYLSIDGIELYPVTVIREIPFGGETKFTLYATRESVNELRWFMRGVRLLEEEAQTVKPASAL